MGYQKVHMNYEEAITEIGKYKYALLYGISSIKLCHPGDVTGELRKECYEARFFREDGELHFFGDNLEQVVSVSDQGSEDTLNELYVLANRFNLDNKKLVEVKKYLETDQDGQMRVVLTRLSDLK